MVSAAVASTTNPPSPSLILSAASLVLARQGDRLIKKIEERIEQQAGRHFDPVAADARARTEDTADLPRGVESVEATVRAPW